MDRLLKNYVMQHYRVGERTLQRWFRAGVVPGAYRTKGVRGHYRIRKPKGVTVDDFCQFVAGRAAINVSTPARIRPMAFAHAVKDGKLSMACIAWGAELERNVRDYKFLMKPLWAYERTTGRKLPFRTLKELRDAVTTATRPKATPSSGTSSSVAPAVVPASAPGQ